MNESQANKAVFIAAAVLVVATFLEDKYAPIKPATYKRLWGIGVLTLLLSITADFVPEVAGPLALLIIVSVGVHDSKYFGMATGTNTKKARTA